MLVCGAAFPFFNNVDEYDHYDLVHKLARGHWPPPRPAAFDPASVALCVEWASPEFVRRPEPGTSLPPPLRADVEPRASARRRALTRYCGDRVNLQTSAPPVYYALAGAWLRLGRALGLAELPAAYWVRFLNAPLLAALVWLAWRFCRRFVPEPPAARLALPALLACLPQDSFYAITRDALSPLLFLAALAALLDWRARERPGAARSAALGLASAAAVLTRLTNGVLLLLLAGVGLRHARRLGGRALAVAGATALVPVALWCARNLALAGDLTGTAAKVEALGWRPAAGPLGSHPLFTPEGLWTFSQGLLATLWRGELFWYAERMAHPAVDLFCVLSSLLFLGAAAVAALRRRAAGTPLGILFVAFGVPVLALAGLSLAYDFGPSSYYPTRAQPFVTSGRLASGALVPFLVLWVRGASRLLGESQRALGVLTALVCAALLVSELALDAPVFASPYNLFHAP